MENFIFVHCIGSYMIHAFKLAGQHNAFTRISLLKSKRLFPGFSNNNREQQGTSTRINTELRRVFFAE